MLALKASIGPHDLYSWVASYLQSLQAVAIGGSVAGTMQDQRRIEEILQALGWNVYSNDGQITDLDFHNLDSLLAGVSQNHLSQDKEVRWTHQLNRAELQQWRQDKRLSSPWHWRLYFAFETPEYAITQDEWLALVDAANQSTNALSTAIEEVLGFRGKQRPNVAGQLLDWIIHEKKGKLLKHSDRWLEAIVSKSSFLKSRSPKDRVFGFTNLFELYLTEIAVLVFNDCDNEQRKRLIEAIFGDSENVDVGAELLLKQMRADSKSSYDKEREMFLNDKELESAKGKQLSLFRQLSPEQFWKLNWPYEVLLAWQLLVKDGKQDSEPVDFLEKAMETDEGLVRTLDALRVVSSSAQDGIARLPHSYLRQYVDIPVLSKRLDDIANNGGELGEMAGELGKLWWSDDED